MTLARYTQGRAGCGGAENDIAKLVATGRAEIVLAIDGKYMDDVLSPVSPRQGRYGEIQGRPIDVVSRQPPITRVLHQGRAPVALPEYRLHIGCHAECICGYSDRRKRRTHLVLTPLEIPAVPSGRIPISLIIEPLDREIHDKNAMIDATNSLNLPDGHLEALPSCGISYATYA